MRIVDLFAQAQSQLSNEENNDATLQQEAIKALDTALQQRTNEASTLQYAKTIIRARFVVAPTLLTSSFWNILYAGVCLTRT